MEANSCDSDGSSTLRMPPLLLWCVAVETRCLLDLELLSRHNPQLSALRRAMLPAYSNNRDAGAVCWQQVPWRNTNIGAAAGLELNSNK